MDQKDICHVSFCTPKIFKNEPRRDTGSRETESEGDNELWGE